jgi:hypothetical protein
VLRTVGIKHLVRKRLITLARARVMIRDFKNTNGRRRLRLVRAYALAQLGDDLAINVFVRRDEAWAALEDALRDKPAWAGMLFVAPIELD